MAGKIGQASRNIVLNNPHPLALSELQTFDCDAHDVYEADNVIMYIQYSGIIGRLCWYQSLVNFNGMMKVSYGLHKVYDIRCVVGLPGILKLACIGQGIGIADLHCLHLRCIEVPTVYPSYSFRHFDNCAVSGHVLFVRAFQGFTSDLAPRLPPL